MPLFSNAQGVVFSGAFSVALTFVLILQVGVVSREVLFCPKMTTGCSNELIHLVATIVFALCKYEFGYCRLLEIISAGCHYLASCESS